MTAPVSFSSVFIIDPLYTLPILLGLIGCLIFNRRKKDTSLFNLVGLSLSTVYLLSSMLVKVWVEDQMQKGLKQQGIEYHALFSTPAPFNTLLWRGVAMTEFGYYEIYYSILDSVPPRESQFYTNDRALIESLGEQWAINRLDWFTRGFYKVDQRNDQIVISDLRMGLEGAYVFEFAVAEVGPSGAQAIPVQRVPSGPDMSVLGSIWDRIWDQTVKI